MKRKEATKFELYEESGKYRFRMSLSSDRVMLRSEAFAALEQCEKAMHAATRIVKSEKVYFAEREVLSGSDFTELPLKVTAFVDMSSEVPVTESAVGEQAVAAESNTGVVFNTTRKTLWELCAELTPKQREYFDEIRARAEKKAKVRSSQSKDAYTVFYGRDKIVKLRIRKNTVETVFFVTDSAFKSCRARAKQRSKKRLP